MNFTIEKGNNDFNIIITKWIQHIKKENLLFAERFIIRILTNKTYECMTSIWKNLYVDKLVDVANKYNNTYHRTIKMEPSKVKPSTYINSDKKNNKEDPNFFIMPQYQNMKMVLLNINFQIGPNKFLWLNKLKTLWHGHNY